MFIRGNWMFYKNALHGGIMNFLGSGTKHGSREKKAKSTDKSKHMYMERRKGSAAVVVYDPDYRPGNKRSSNSRPHSVSQAGSMASMPPPPPPPPPRAMTLYQPSAVPPPPVPPTYAESQYGPGGSRFGGQVPARSFRSHRYGDDPSAPVPIDLNLPRPEPPSPGPRYRYCSEERECHHRAQQSPQCSPAYTPSVAGRSSVGGSIDPDDSASQYSGNSRRTARPERHAHSGHPGHPGSVGKAKASDKLWLSWVGPESSSKRTLYEGKKPHGNHPKRTPGQSGTW
ncbi:hypothetical protein F5B19DRAFT_479428 [Rostrohypoxylon terebratum]|nr:hypothetical protein F5B19DRAFT_479428 [Rostrohypoxylon terebratum]